MLERITIMAAGTGGHVFPGLAIAQAFQQAGVEVHWLGSLSGMEKRWVESAGIPFAAISIGGLRGKGVSGWLQAPVRVSRAVGQARQILERQGAQAVLGMGGFVCGPGGLAARSLGLPLFIHEQNAVAGLTNRLLAPLSQGVFAGLPFQRKPLPGALLMGNPVRESIEQVPAWQAHEAPWRILVLGGSRGALALNEQVPQALAQLQVPIEVRHQAGEQTLHVAQQAYQAAGVAAAVTSFIEDMASAYAWADLVICRAGALTVSEIMAVGRAAILVPFPYAVDKHQQANAMALVEQGAGVCLPQQTLTPQILAQQIADWLDSARLASASAALRRAYQPGAAQRIVAQILERMGERSD